MSNVIELPVKRCVECGALAPKELGLVSETGEAFSKFYCDKHLPRPLDEDGLRLLVDVRDAEIERLRAVLSGVEVALARDENIDGAMKLIVEARAFQQKGGRSDVGT